MPDDSTHFAPESKSLPDDGMAPLGAEFLGDSTRFSLFTSPGRSCFVRLFDQELRATGTYRMHPTEASGVWSTTISHVLPGALYKFVLDDTELPDPYARFLPHGVHGPAMVIDPAYAWKHLGVSRPLRQHVMYELHVGTFTEAGTYQAAAQHLDHLVELGVTALELMPIGTFPGRWGWGYDGVAAFAPFAPYGSPDELRAFVDLAHGRGLAVLLDVVYNHMGPDGNYLSAYSSDYFSRDAKNAWGDAPNFAHPAMRRYALSNALYWLREFRFDGLRLDATHAILDDSAKHVLRELSDAVATLSPPRLLIAEDERNDPALVSDLRLDAVWADDFHHAVCVTATHERDGYYGAYQPGAETIARAINRGWLFEGDVYPPTGQRRGSAADALAAECFVYCIQNHDQVGNRAFGDRLCASLTPEAYRAVSVLLLYLPMTPLLFMGQEWAATSPFQFFTDHEPVLGKLVSQGRREEFNAFSAFQDPAQRENIPDPQSAATFEASKLRWSELQADTHAAAFRLYKAALALRANDRVMQLAGRKQLEAASVGNVLVVRRWWGDSERVLLANLGAEAVRLESLPQPKHAQTLLTSDGAALTASLAPWHAVVLAGEVQPAR
jgi:maltooligosyltrehalose trehalohydrolase